MACTGPFGRRRANLRHVGSEETPHDAGRRAVATLRQHLAVRVAEALQRDPQRAEQIIALGLVSREWLEAPTSRPLSDLQPAQALERWISRFVAEHPTLLERFGHPAIEVLGEDAEPDEGETVVTTHLAILFTDLAGFTAHTQRVGDAAASRLLTDHYETVEDIVEVRGGRVAKRLGDGLMITFPTEQAAVLAGLELLHCAPKPLSLRAGAHSGEVVTTGEDVFGHVVNVASRVAERADGGSLLVTVDVADSASDLRGVRYDGPRPVVLRGVEKPIGVYDVRRSRGLRGRSLPSRTSHQ